MYTKWRGKMKKTNWDAIVIGSGLSGLATAATLSLRGMKVLVLESHDRPGGCLHTFSEQKVEFSTGNHYVGVFDKDMTTAWNFITNGKCHLMPKKEEIVETFYENGKKHILRKGKHNWQRVMHVDPNKVERMADRMKWFVFFKVLPSFIAYFLWIVFWTIYPDTTKTYNEWMTENSSSPGPWLMQEGDHGVKKEDCLAMVGAAVTRHYMNGTVEFPKDAVRQICKTIKNQGGQVYVCAKVKRIILSNDIVGGVQLEDDTIFLAPRVISSVGVHNTSFLVNSPLFTKCTLVRPSVSHFSVFIGLNGTKKSLNLPEGNLWIRNSGFSDIFISFDEQIKSSGDKYVAVHVLSPYPKPGSWFKMESSDYDCKKKSHAQILRNVFYNYFPNTKKSERVFVSGTPTTSKHYLNSFRGCSYGLECSSERFTDWKLVRELRPETRILGLFLTGQDILMMGICSALASAVITSRQVLGYSIWNAISGSDIIDEMRRFNKKHGFE